MKIQTMLYPAIFLWHRLHIFFYQRLGAARLSKGMPPPQSLEADKLMALCRKSDRHIRRVMELRFRLEQAKHSL